MDKERRQQTIAGMALSILGLIVILLALNIIPAREVKFNAPAGITFVMGLVFLFTGLAVYAKRYSPLSLFFVSLALFTMSVVFFWAALKVPAGEISGEGDFFLPTKMAGTLGKVVFGIMGLLFALVGISASKSGFCKRK
ncbi:MAG: hypothetical protein V1727_01425 [Candidatus Omnitrophota bacterium]